MAAANEVDVSAVRQMKTQMSEGAQSEAGSSHGNKTTSQGAVPKDRERKIGHRRVDEKTGTVTYKKKSTSELMKAIQLGIGQSVGGLSSKPERDLLMQDFGVVQSVFFPSEGSNMTPAHHYSDFRFKTYAPLAFRYFRELFNIRPDDFMLSLCDEAMTELSNPGAGGSIFYISADDEFIIKTAQHKEANFLQKLLPGYYMNLNQNPRTLLPKFYGLYCYQCGGKNIRFVVMNNILPSVVKLHEKYDLKGSTYKRKASKSERAKSSPTLKDLDFMELHPDGLMLEKDTYEALIKTIQRDCRVLESFKIMDYSLLVGIHNLDVAKKERMALESARSAEAGTPRGLGSSQGNSVSEANDVALARGKSMRTKVTQYSTPMESIQAEVRDMLEEFDDEDIPPGGIPAKNAKGDRLLIFLGIIDILQCYRFRKKFEHTFKSMITDGDTVSVTRPSFYSERFQKFFINTVFKKAPSPLKHSPSKRKPGERGPRSESIREETTIPGTMGARPDLLMGSSTPPPTFNEAVTSGARPRARTSNSPLPAQRTSDDFQRSDRTHFQTISQQEGGSLSRVGSAGTRMLNSPQSVSESTPTFTEYTEGTPSYTASSPSLCSEVIDATVPNLPLDSLSMSPDVSPSKTMAASSSTEASYYSAASQLDTVSDHNIKVSKSEGNSHLIDTNNFNNTKNYDSKSADHQLNVKRTVIEISPGNRSPVGNIPSEANYMMHEKHADTSFSSDATSGVGYTESTASSGTSTSPTLEQDETSDNSVNSELSTAGKTVSAPPYIKAGSKAVTSSTYVKVGQYSESTVTVRTDKTVVVDSTESGEFLAEADEMTYL